MNILALRLSVIFIVLLILVLVILDIAEGRLFIQAFKREQQFANEQRAIQDFVLSNSSAIKCNISKQERSYQTYTYTQYESLTIKKQPTILIIPGALQDIKKHEYVGFRLACEGRRVIFAPLELLRQPIQQRFDELVMNMLGFADHIRQQHETLELIVGHSLGGLITMRMAMVDSSSRYIAFQPFLGFSPCISSVIAHKLENIHSNKNKSNDMEYIFKNYKFILEAQEMTQNQAGYLKADLDIYIAQYEHLVDNQQVFEFVKNKPATYVNLISMQSTHFFGKSESVIQELLIKSNTA